VNYKSWKKQNGFGGRGKRVQGEAQLVRGRKRKNNREVSQDSVDFFRPDVREKVGILSSGMERSGKDHLGEKGGIRRSHLNSWGADRWEIQFKANGNSCQI